MFKPAIERVQQKMGTGKKNRAPSLLVEPSIEDELEANAIERFTSQKSYQDSSSRIGEGRSATRGQQEEEGNEENVIKSQRFSCRLKQRKNDQAERKQLTNLLATLFGSIMLLVLICLLSAASASASNSTQSPAVNVTLPAASGILFNSSQSEPATTLLPEVEDEPTTSIDPFASSEVTPTTNLPDATTFRTPTNSTTTTTTTTSTTTTSGPTTTSEEVAELGPDEEPEVESTNTSGGRLSPGLMIESAGEAADQLIARLKPAVSDEASAAEEEDGDTLSTSDGESPSVDRRDNLAVASSPLSKQPEQTLSADELQLKMAMETWTRWKSTSDDFIELFSRKMLPLIVEHGYDIDAVTVTGLLQVFNGIRALKPWALKLLDASVKLTPGLLVGTQSDFGDFDECLNVRVDDPSGLLDTSAPIELDEATGLRSSALVGRYCLADVEFPKPPRQRLAQRNEELQTDYAPIELRKPLLNFSETAAFKETIFVETGNFFHMLYVDPIRVGVCLTNKIDPESFAQVFNKLLEEFKVSINFKGRCVTKYDKIEWTIQQKVSACVILVACSLVLLCTLLDILHNKLNKLPLPSRYQKGQLKLQNYLLKYRPLFTSFSIIRNTKRLFRPQASKLEPASATIAGSSLPLSSCGTSAASKLTSSINSSSCSSSSSSESSPSIERRSSSESSGMNLISDSSMPNKQVDQWAQFSPAKNQVKKEKRQNNMLCLHGIRVITMTWMIVNHTYLFGGFFVLWAYRRLIDIAEWPKSISFQLVLNGWLTVETYFFLGATIIVLSVMPAMKARKFTYTSYILHRLLRLLPAYAGLVSLNFLWPLVSSGPVWLVKGKSFIQTPCENYLWTNFLFVNNWIWPEKQCMVHTWFLSADFQLYLLAPIIVYLLYRRPVFGHTVNIIVAIIASCFSGLVIYANKLMPTTLINKLEFDSIKQQLSYSYFATYQHIGPYCLGIFTGYLLYKRPQVQLPKHLTWLLWILLPPLSFTTLLLTYLWNGAYEDPALINPSPIVSAFYVAIHRTIWTSLVAWIVFACATGRAKLLSSFLSHSMFIPLSRLSFSIYLVHLPVIMYRALNLRHTIEWTDSNILWEACGNFIVSVIVGYFVNVTFESPIINLEQVVFGRRQLAPMSQNEGLNKQISGANGRLKLRPQLPTSKTSSENDSDDNKSSDLTAESDSQEKVAGGSGTSAMGLETASQILSQHMQWTSPGGGAERDVDFRNSLRPKDPQSVERIYGQRLEPASLVSNYADVEDENDDGESLSTPKNIRPPKQQVAPKVKPARRLSAHDLPDRMIMRKQFVGDDNIYHLASESHRHVAPRSQSIDQERASHYATLARSSQLESHESAGLSVTLGPQYMSSKGSATRPRSQFGATSDSISRSAYADNVAESGNSWQQDQYRGIRRQGRYNTLTGANQREWIQHLPNIDGNRLAAHSKAGARHRRNEDLSNIWMVQPGTMLPRIDSSTLRGHQRSHHPTGSILEEEREEGSR